MKVGKYSHKVYPEDYNKKSYPECCCNVSKENTEDEDYMQELRTKNLADCIPCMSCPASKHNLYKDMNFIERLKAEAEAVRGEY